ncbi:hypothetical protein BACCAP_02941 [Pseudoflavonifractor capillosus ATCC 29799]|uniref:Uncharacterized protein n=1 Tax=Pseudoflavonifractor capillosus ATCC 29799 TaxID=411467 RepID=A6NXJ4_9FIRM|nr:hypothetical protein BACCAP_02941 [Pseudoflavonifractor capillosus ATCC 29799]
MPPFHKKAEKTVLFPKLRFYGRYSAEKIRFPYYFLSCNFDSAVSDSI